MNNPGRIVSIDVFRGLTIAAMILVNYPGLYGQSYAPLEHAAWEGVTPTDFIFPFFIFIMGISVVLSFTKQVQEEKRKTVLIKKIMVRSFELYGIGFFLHFLPNLTVIRLDWFGVLQRIAIVYFCCSLLFLYTSRKTQLLIFLFLVLGYWIALCFIPTPEFSAGTIEPGHNFASWFDRLFFAPETLGKRGWNSEGLFSTLPAIATGLIGMFAGYLIQDEKKSEKGIIRLFIAGTFCILLGSAWNWQFPIIKKIWTSSYVLYTAGWALLLLATSIWLIDVKGYKNNPVARTGIIFGSNAIAIYVMADIFETIYKHTHIHDFVYYGLINQGLPAKSVSLIWALISVGSCFLVACFLHRKRIFIKL
jgi:predicted acyltransferase